MSQQSTESTTTTGSEGGNEGGSGGAGAGTSGGSGGHSKSLADLLAGLDDTAKAAVLGEVDKARNEAAGYRRRVRELEPKAKAHDEVLEAQKTAEQKAQEQAQRDRETAAQAIKRAVRAEVKALAADSFADPEDASAFLGDLAEYVSDDGEIDTKRIESDLKALLERKPHLAKGERREPRRPLPDRSQGSSGNGRQSAPDTTEGRRQLFGDFLRTKLSTTR